MRKHRSRLELTCSGFQSRPSLGPGRSRPPYPIVWFFHPYQVLHSREWLLVTRLCFLTCFCHCSPPGNECPKLQPPVHGKIEPLQAKYSFKDQVLISCDTGYKVLKVQSLAGAWGWWGGQSSSPEPPRADVLPEPGLVPPQYFLASPLTSKMHQMFQSSENSKRVSQTLSPESGTKVQSVGCLSFKI